MNYCQTVMEIKERLAVCILGVRMKSHFPNILRLVLTSFDLQITKTMLTMLTMLTGKQCSEYGNCQFRILVR